MNRKEWKRRAAYEALVILGVMALLLFITRLWPILLLVILGIFIATLRLLFLSFKGVKSDPPVLMLPPPAEKPTWEEVRDMTFSHLIDRITQLVQLDYPDAKWIWEVSSPKERLERGGEVWILLNRAGGYCRARVVMQGLQEPTLDYQINPAATAPTAPLAEEPEENPPASEHVPENYGLMAFEWVDTHVMDLNQKCNEVIGLGQFELLLKPDELPPAQSWPDICKELIRNGLEKAEATADGIHINLKQ